jgi:hypothetical protein
MMQLTGGGFDVVAAVAVEANMVPCSLVHVDHVKEVTTNSTALHGVTSRELFSILLCWVFQFRGSHFIVCLHDKIRNGYTAQWKGSSRPKRPPEPDTSADRSNQSNRNEVL